MTDPLLQDSLDNMILQNRIKDSGGDGRKGVKGDKKRNDDGGSSTGMVIGIVFGVFVLIFVIVVALLLYRR